MTLEEQGQTQAERSEARQSVTGTSNDTETCRGGASVGKPGKNRVESRQSVENRKNFETKKEKRQFISESFQLDVNEILNADENLKEAVIKLFLDNFEVLAPHPSQYGETKGLEMKID